MLVVTLAAALGIPVSEDPLVAALAAMAGEGPPVLPAALPLAHEANELSLVPARTPMSICRKLRHDRAVDEHSDVVRTIPFGETASYGEQAERMGDKRKARAVGAANGRNPISIVIPCHRVVGSNGSLTGFAGGIEVKAWLLQHEASTAGTTLPF